MGSVRRRGGAVRVSLDGGEAAFLLSLVSQVISLLAGPTPGPATGGDPLDSLVGLPTEPVAQPTDPALLRLLPDAYNDDDEAATEFRRLTDAGLRATKRARLERILADFTDPSSRQRDGGVKLELHDDAVEAWLPALTDLRLTLGTRIGVTDDIDEQRDSAEVGSPRYAELAAYDWLAWLQDAMVQALLRG
jgi:hypothetical protein